ncbi:MAG: hypothetical protein KKD39_04330, partial [Candidatus Altiarchaeota archaeon]|nr:hypothetical protein [Candidatus Altiarchaeota archaeon]
PTVYDMVGVKPPETITGKSLLPIITGKETENRVVIGKNIFDKFIRYGDLKLIIQGVDHIFLYNITADPGEKNDLLKEMPDEAVKLEALLYSKENEDE